MSIFSRLPADSRRPGAAEAALKADYEQFYGKARAFAERHVGDVWAEDVVQDSFLRLWMSWYKDGREVPRESSRRIFFHILRDRITDQIRQFVAEDTRNANPAFLSSPHLRLERSTATADVADASILAKRIEHHVSAMPDAMRRVHDASLDHRGDVTTIAVALGMSEEAVYKALKRGRARLRDQLRKDGYDVPGEPEVHRVSEP